jgi:hypothetical protein
MKWLITVRKTADLDGLTAEIRACGGEPDPGNPPTPLGEDELVVQAEGPREFPDAMKARPDVIEVYPDSEMELY